VFLLYISGLVDSPNQPGEMFDAERLDDALRRLNGDRMVFLNSLFAEIDTFLAGQAPFDDCTAIVMDFHRAT
jgi:serine phosphatase RsbU (regulator of sigma subunit)